MKKSFSILLVLLVLLSSLHFTIATHFCGGHIALVKAGLEGTTASCGMENDRKNCSTDSKVLSTDCCKNTAQVLSVDNFQTTPSLQIQKINHTLLQVFLVPVLQILDVSPLIGASFADAGFHQPLLSLSERLAFICVFRK